MLTFDMNTDRRCVVKSNALRPSPKKIPHPNEKQLPFGERLIRLGVLLVRMATIVPPRERTCERCGREDTWNDETENWVVDGDVGDPFCLHSWDINGSYNPVKD